MIHSKTKLKLSQLAISILLIGQVSPVIAQTAPTSPTAPEAPDSPDAPEAPDSPDAPDAPDTPDSPTAPEEPSDEPNDLPVDDNLDESPVDENNPSSENPEPAADNPIPEPTDSPGIPAVSGDPSDPETKSDDNGGVVGDVEIDTGDAVTTAIGVTNANNNIALASDAENPGITVNNDGNGSDSDNNASIGISNDGIVIQDNSADVVNNLEADTATGDNNASKNVGNSTIETGDANTTGTLINTVNTNVDGVSVYEFNIADDYIGDYVLDFNQDNCISGCASGYDVTNTGNGSDSTNNADLSAVTSDASFQNNDADLENNMVLASDSGNNTADNNTGGDNEIDTGDANVSANVVNFANNNIAGGVIYSVVNVFGDLVGDILFPEEVLNNTTLANSDNGSDSTNTADVDISNSDETYQYNEANIQNNILADTNTGDNATSANTGGNNEIETGDTSTNVSVLNIANTNIVGDMWLVLVNTAGQWLGQIMGADADGNIAVSAGLAFEVDENGQINVGNSGNGSGSTNDASINQTNNSTTVQNNTANIVNNLDLSANTGGNSTSRNTGGDNSITTGDANIIANIVNYVNNNIAGDGRLFVNVVNVFGSWIGDFVTPGYQKEASPTQVNQVAQAENNHHTPAIGGYQTHSNGSTSASNDDNNSQSTTVIAEPLDEDVFAPTAAPTQIAARRYPRPQIAGIVEAKVDPESAVEEAADAVIASAESSKVNINLAWLLLLAPPAALGLFVKRVFL